MNSAFLHLILCRELEYFVVDRSLTILEFSPSANRFSEFPEEIEMGRDIRLALPELSGMEEPIDSLGQEGCPNCKLKNIAKTIPGSSSICYVDLYIGCIPAESEGESNLLILLEDTTEQAIVQQTLFQQVNESTLLKTAWCDSHKYFDKIINSMADSLIVTNPQGIIKKINPAARKMFEYEEYELVDRPINILISQSENLPALNLDSARQNRDFLLDVEVDCITKTERKIRVLFSYSIIQLELTDIPDLVYLGKDVTQRIKKEDNLRETLENEKEINKFKSNFLSSISNKIRTPLNSLLLTLELLQDIKNEEQDEIIRSIESNIKTLIQAIEDIILVNKTENFTVHLSENSIDVTHVCQQLVSEIKLSLGDSERLKFIKNDQIQGRCDLKILKYILTTIIKSIIKYSSSNLEIEIKTDICHQKILFEVLDRSCEFSQEDREDILSDNKISKRAGLGLEFAIVQKYIEIYGGRIELESEVEVGTVFRVVLPFIFDTIDDR